MTEPVFRPKMTWVVPEDFLDAVAAAKSNKGVLKAFADFFPNYPIKETTDATVHNQSVSGNTKDTGEVPGQVALDVR